MKTALLGGSFDPVHNGHLLIAREILSRSLADRVIVLPNGPVPYRQHRACARDRCEMARLAFRDIPGVTVSDIEACQDSFTYTSDTVRRLRISYPDDELLFVIGTDKLSSLPHWHDIDLLSKCVSFLTVSRPGMACRADAGSLPVIPSGITGPALSSSHVRELVSSGSDISSLVPPAVADYIRDTGLYLMSLPPEDAEKELEASLKPSRFLHTQGVVQKAVSLAPRYGIPTGKARVAALLHDCAKNLPPEEQYRLAVEWGDCDEEELASPAILHAPAGAVLAQRKFGVQDPDILNAIRGHTIGRSGMSMLEHLIFTADFIEDGRRSFPGLAEAREAAEHDLVCASLLCAGLTSRYLAQEGHSPHPRTVRWTQELTLNKQQEEI